MRRGAAARPLVAGIALSVALGVWGTGAGAQQVAAPELVAAACALPREYLVRIWRGVDPSRSAELLVVPEEPNFLGTNFPHSGPWNYLQRVPLLWYGPGVIPAVGAVDRPVTIASIAPTEARLLGFGFDAPDGRALREVAQAAPATPPRLIVTLVWDGGGRNVLDAWPDAWPYLRSLIPRGVWYERATVGSSPSITPATHATIGAGAFPRRTGQVDSEFRLGPFITRSGALGPGLLMRPTLADLYDRAMGNEPEVGVVASVTWHLNMMGHGAMWGGGDRDLAVLRGSTEDEGAEGDAWNLQGKNRPFYRFPSYVNRLPPISAYTRRLDQQDGALDGRWRDNDIAQLRDGWDTPARVPYQTRVVEEVVRREGFGDDDVPDLLFVNYKIIDHVGHVWSANGVEMGDTVAWQDRGLRELVRFLDRAVGRGAWAGVTADHGHQFDTGVSGGFGVPPRELQADLTAAFDGDGDPREAIELVRTSQVYLDLAELRENGHDVEDVARFVLRYTKGQVQPGLPPDQADDRVFAAAIPTADLAALPCLAGLGP
jgi:hypothetical protein